MNFSERSFGNITIREHWRSSAKTDPFLLATLSSDSVHPQIRTAFAKELFEGVINEEEGHERGSKRVGAFLRTSVEVYKNHSTPTELKRFLFEHFTAGIFEGEVDPLEDNQNSKNKGLIFASSKGSWQEEDVQAVLDAYTTFMTLDKVLGKKEAEEAYKKITEELIRARSFTHTLDKITQIVPDAQRGSIIELSPLGAEAMQTVVKRAYLDTSEAEGMDPCISPYYRDQILETNLGSAEADPKHILATPVETLADLGRFMGGTRGPNELPLGGGVITTEGKISQLPATANIAGHIRPGVGMAAAVRLKAVNIEAVRYSKPEGADAWRRLELKKGIPGSVLISFGDGASFGAEEALHLASLYKTPSLFFIQDNGIAIGTKKGEAIANPNLWQMGKGRGIPGINIKLTDLNGAYMATRFATKRAHYDGGPTILHIETVRLGPHSSQHGDPTTDSYKAEISKILKGSDYSMTYPVLGAGVNNQSILRIRLEELLQKDILDNEKAKHLEAIKNRIIDPQKVMLSNLIASGYACEEEISTWHKDADNEMLGILDQVLALPKPRPEQAFENMRMTPIEIPSVLPFLKSTVTLNGAEAFRSALKNLMQENPNILYWGTDVNKGVEFRRGEINQVGGYFHQADGLHNQFGLDPLRVTNTPIGENAMAAFLMGMSLTPTDPDIIKDSLRILYDPQYADYGIQASEALHILSSAFFTTRGRTTRMFGMILEEGAVAGGGPMHTHSVAGEVNTTKYPIDIFSISDPETLYKVMQYCLRYETNPYIIMVDKTMFLAKPSSFEIGTGIFEAGRAKVDKKGKDVQIITYGPAKSAVAEAVIEMEGVGILDLFSHRPFPLNDVKDYLKEGAGPIVIVGQEAEYKAFTAHVKTTLEESEDKGLRNALKGRTIYRINGKNVPELSADGIVMRAAIPTTESIRNFIQPLRSAKKYA